MDTEQKTKASACVCRGASYSAVHRILISVEGKKGEDKKQPFPLPLARVPKLCPDVASDGSNGLWPHTQGSILQF